MPDRTLICQDCSREFVFTEGEQEFYKEKGLQNEPKRCPECRKAKKAQFNRNRRRQSNQIVSNLLTPLLKCSGVFVCPAQIKSCRSRISQINFRSEVLAIRTLSKLVCYGEFLF